MSVHPLFYYVPKNHLNRQDTTFPFPFRGFHSFYFHCILISFLLFHSFLSNLHFHLSSKQDPSSKLRYPQADTLLLLIPLQNSSFLLTPFSRTFPSSLAKHTIPFNHSFPIRCLKRIHFF